MVSSFAKEQAVYGVLVSAHDVKVATTVVLDVLIMEHGEEHLTNVGSKVPPDFVAKVEVRDCVAVLDYSIFYGSVVSSVRETQVVFLEGVVELYLRI